MNQKEIETAAKTIEAHAESGYIPDVLYRELNNMKPEDRLAIAKEITWNQAHENKALGLPDVDLVFDERSGDLKQVNKVDRYGSVITEIDPATGKKRAETEVTKSGNWEHFQRNEYNDKGRLTSQVEVSSNGFIEVEKWDYDATTGKLRAYEENSVSYDGKTIFPRVGTEKGTYDPKSGEPLVTDITTPNGTERRTYQYGTDGKLHREVHHKENNDKSVEDIVYAGTGNMMSKHKVYENGASNHWTYDPRTGKELALEHIDSKGNVDQYEYDEKLGRLKRTGGKQVRP